jgi:AcrR family transcriptional regulator
MATRQGKKTPSGKAAAAGSSAPYPRPKTDTYHHGNLKSAMLEAALHLLRTEGLAGMSLRRAAELAGVTRTAPAHHFQNKNGLLAALAAYGYKQMTTRRTKAMRPDMSDTERLAVALKEYVYFAIEEPQLFHLMFGPFVENRDAYPELVDAQRAAYYMLTHFAVAAFGESTKNGMVIQPYACWALAHGLATLLIDQPGAPSTIQHIAVEKLVEQIVAAGLSGFSVLTTHGEPRRSPAGKS